MRYLWRALLAGGLGFAAAFVVACGGGGGLLSGDQGSTLNDQLNQISSAVDAGNCGAAASAVTGFANAVAGLPPSINPTLRANLAQGASTVSQLAAKQCRQQSAPTTTTSTSSSSTPTTTTSTSSTSSTTTTPTTTSSSTTTSTSTATTPTSTGTSSSAGSGGAGIGAASGGAAAGLGGAGDETGSQNGQ